MMYDKDRKTATPKAVGVCSCCGSELVPKCGRVKVWHWAHKNLLECDEWYEMSAWHLGWQNMVCEECREVVVGCHRADIKLKSGLIVELQHSSLSIDDIEEREEYYGNMIWLFDGSGFYDKMEFRFKQPEHGDEYVTWTWKRPRAYIVECTKPVYIDFPPNEDYPKGIILEVKKFRSWDDEEGKPKKYGWGRFYPKSIIKNMLFRGSLNVTPDNKSL
jgi:hypothetical protein